MNKKKIKKKYPSLCYSCENSRRVASEKNEEKGYVGCCGRVMKIPFDADVIINGTEVGEGWVDLRSSPFSKSSGMITNFQLITLEIQKCEQFNKRKSWRTK